MPDIQQASRSHHALPRRAELLAINRGLRDASAGKAAILALTGAPGSGKTFLGSAAVSQARQLGFRVATASGRTLGTVPLLVAHVVARQLDIELRSEADASTAISQLHRGIEALARGSAPVLLLFDDADGYDPVDLALLEQLLLRPPAGRLAILVTARTTVAGRSEDTLIPLLDRLSESGPLDLHVLGPLTALEVKAMYVDRFDGAFVSSRFVDDILRLSGGSASHLSTFADALYAMPEEDRTQWLIGNRSPDDFPLPAALERAISRRLDAGDPNSRALLQVIAVGLGGLSVAEMAKLVGIGEGEATERLAQLESSRLLRWRDGEGASQFEFADEMVRRVAYAQTPSLVQRRLHDAAAAILEAGNPGEGEVIAAAELAEHYVRGTLPLDKPRTASVVEGARFYARTGRYAAAVRLLEGGGRKLEAVGRSLPGEGLAILGESYVRQGEIGQAEEILRQAQTRGGSNGHADFGSLIHRLIRIRITQGDEETALELSDAAVKELGSLAPSDQITLLGDLASLKHLAGQPDQSRELAEWALALAEETGDTEGASSEARKLMNFALTAGEHTEALKQGRRARRLARAADSRRAACRAALGVGLARLQSGSLRRALLWIRRSRRGAIASGDRATEALATFHLARALLEAGHWDLAAQAADEAVDLDAALHRDRALGPSRALRARLEIGRHAAGAAGGASWFQGRVPALDVAISEGVSLVDQHVEAESWERAAAILEEIEDRMAATAGWEYHRYVDILPRASLVYARSGNRPHLLATVEQMEDAPLKEGVALAAVELGIARARLAGLDGDASEAAAQLEHAAESLGRLGFEYKRATTLAEAGTAWTDAGHERRAAALLKDAYQRLEVIGAARGVERVRAALHTIHRRAPARAPSRADGELTSRQRDVAALAMEGQSDADIASTLGISERTVTTHMHHILQKLSLRSRHQLKREMSMSEAM